MRWETQSLWYQNCALFRVLSCVHFPLWTLQKILNVMIVLASLEQSNLVNIVFICPCAQTCVSGILSRWTCMNFFSQYIMKSMILWMYVYIQQILKYIFYKGYWVSIRLINLQICGDLKIASVGVIKKVFLCKGCWGVRKSWSFSCKMAQAEWSKGSVGCPQVTFQQKRPRGGVEL